jgi:hypothetical protein
VVDESRRKVRVSKMFDVELRVRSEQKYPSFSTRHVVEFIFPSPGNFEKNGVEY